MGDAACTIDLDTKTASAEQIDRAEDLANQVVMEDRRIDIRFVGLEEARGLGLRKLPPVEREQLRLIDIRDFDLTACGGTHVRSTGQIGAILVRKTEKVRQGVRVEFVCGGRALAAARRDRLALNEAASVVSAHIWEMPQQVRKLADEAKAARKLRSELLNELAELHAARLLQETPEANGFHLGISTALRIGWPSRPATTSPSRSPARAAGDPGWTCVITTPSRAATPSARARSGVRSCIVMPSRPRRTSP